MSLSCIIDKWLVGKWELKRTIFAARPANSYWERFPILSCDVNCVDCLKFQELSQNNRIDTDICVTHHLLHVILFEKWMQTKAKNPTQRILMFCVVCPIKQSFFNAEREFAGRAAKMVSSSGVGFFGLFLDSQICWCILKAWIYVIICVIPVHWMMNVVRSTGDSNASNRQI